MRDTRPVSDTNRIGACMHRIFRWTHLAPAIAAMALAAAAPAAAAPPTVTFRQASAWNDGFTGGIDITNPVGNAPIAGWTLRVRWAVPFTGWWNCLLSQDAGTYVITNEGWNGTIAAGATVSLGFTASGQFAPTVTECTLNGVAATVLYAGGGGGSGGGGSGTALVRMAGVADDALSAAIAPGASTFALTLTNGTAPAAWEAASNNPAVCTASVQGTTLTLTGAAPGLAGIRLRDPASGSERLLGIAVRTASGAFPGMPAHVALGSVSEDTTSQLDYWKSFGTGLANRRVDVRYIYINGGPVNGWRTWTTVAGDRARRYIRESRKLGFIPCFVHYNVPDGGESFTTDSEHLGSAAYMQGYWKDLALFLRICREETADGWPVMVIYEPDLLGYMAQNGIQPTAASWPATGGQAVQVQQAYTTAGWDGAAILGAADPAFPNTLRGFVEAVNYLTRRDLPNAQFGWQFNLWASPPGGWTTPISGKGVMHLTDSGTFAVQVQKVRDEARAIAQYYVACGVATHGATLVSIDKYGLDAGAETGAAANPTGSTWFWNNDHWNNYLAFVGQLHAVSGLPVVLWQLPVGHINTTAEVPAAGGAFPALDNTSRRYEDSAPDFFLGDTFDAGARTSFFQQNRWADPKLTAAGPQLTWGAHVQEARDAGVSAMLFGPGVGDSTANIPASGTFDTVGTDGGWFMQRAQRYLQSPVPLVPACAPDLNRDGAVDGADLGTLLAAWGPASAGAAADLDRDGTVSGSDLGLLLASWGPCQ